MKIKDSLIGYKKNLINSYVYFNYYHRNIDNHIIYAESMDGNDFSSNMLHLIEELSHSNYGNFKIYVYAKKEIHPKILNLQKRYNLNIFKLIDKEYNALKILERAKYILTDSYIRPSYIKRPEQIVININIETPFEVLDNSNDYQKIGDIQKSLIYSDYIIFYSDYMKEVFLSSSRLTNFIPGKILMEGSPKNSILFDIQKTKQLKSDLALDNKEIIVYYPKYRKNSSTKNIKKELLKLDKQLNDNQLLLIKRENIASNLNFSKFNHISDFPEHYDDYDIINLADTLITDYHEVIFSFANCKRKIILFNYDQTEFEYSNETYIQVSDLPFPKVKTISELVNEINLPKKYDETEFLEKYCKYDNINSAKNICNHIFKNKNTCIEQNLNNDEKPNVLIFAGNLLNNEITSSLINLLNNVDTDKFNFFVTYREWNMNVVRHQKRFLDSIPNEITVIPMRTGADYTFFEKIKFNLHRMSKIDLSNGLRNIYERELIKHFSMLKFDFVLNYDGISRHEVLMFSNLGINSSIWVHNDLMHKYKKNRNFNIDLYKKTFKKYDNVNIVLEEFFDSTYKLLDYKDNINILNNIIDCENILSDADNEIQKNKYCSLFTSSAGDIEEVLNKPGKKFISIKNNFSGEKRYKTLIKSFDKFCEDYPNTQLIIIGGYGNFEKLKNKILKLKHWENITIIKGMYNPLPILKQCDLFVLSSSYEGWPSYLIDADVLNIPVMATLITGTKWMKKYNGYFVENSEQGFLQGFHDYMDGKIDLLNINYKDLDEKSIHEFNKLLE